MPEFYINYQNRSTLHRKQMGPYPSLESAQAARIYIDDSSAWFSEVRRRALELVPPVFGPSTLVEQLVRATALIVARGTWETARHIEPEVRAYVERGQLPFEAAEAKAATFRAGQGVGDTE